MPLIDETKLEKPLPVLRKELLNTLFWHSRQLIAEKEAAEVRQRSTESGGWENSPINEKLNRLDFSSASPNMLAYN